MKDIQEKDKIIAIITMFLPKAKIYLFGSYARGEQRHYSDLDIAIDNGQPLPIALRGQIRSIIEALNTIQNVDLVDFRSVPKTLQEEIVRDGILWKE